MGSLGFFTPCKLVEHIRRQTITQHGFRWRSHPEGGFIAEAEDGSVTVHIFEGFYDRTFLPVVLRVSKGQITRVIVQPKPHISQVPLGRALYFFAPLIRLLYPSYTPPSLRTSEERKNAELYCILNELYRLVATRCR